MDWTASSITSLEDASFVPQPQQEKYVCEYKKVEAKMVGSLQLLRVLLN